MVTFLSAEDWDSRLRLSAGDARQPSPEKAKLETPWPHCGERMKRTQPNEIKRVQVPLTSRTPPKTVIPTGAFHSPKEWKAKWRDLLFAGS
jgi:hypothetical protein